jgi:ferritin-like metal-binding protein YciE
MATTADEQLTKYLTDAHAIEEQALAQLRTAPDIAGDPQLAAIFQEHLTETEEQERLVRERLEARGASPSRVKDVVMAVGGKGFVLFARSQPDTPGKLVSHAHSYEALEEAAYELLLRVAATAGDDATAQMAIAIRGQERAMRERLAASFDRAVDASLRDVPRDDVSEQLTKYLADAHALEVQAEQLLARGPRIAGEPGLEQVYAEHLEETRNHKRRVDERLDALGGDTSGLKDIAMRAGALNWGAFFQAQPDTPGKLAAFTYAFEHLEMAGYEQLARVAERAGDAATADLARSILVEERAAAARVAARFDQAAAASLQAVGATR